MAYTLSGLITKVQNRVKDTGFSTSTITDYINDAQRDVFTEYRLNFMEATQTYTTAVNVADITNGVGLPTNYTIAIDLFDVTNNEIIPYKDISYLDNLETTNNSGRFWYKYAGTINLYPTQTTALSVRLRYYKAPTELAADGDVPLIPELYSEILVLGASIRVLETKDNYDQAAILERKYNRKLLTMVGMTSVNQTGSSTKQRINRYSTSKRRF